jgi:hypothetical protein
LDSILRGCTSSVWWAIYEQAHSHQTSLQCLSRWDQKLIEANLTLLKNIWDDRNKHLHGSTKTEARKQLRQQVLNQVRKIYRHPPKLHHRYTPVSKMPLSARLNVTTTHLQRWLARLSQQVKSSKLLSAHDDKDN